jgi:hypothetical protein
VKQEDYMAKHDRSDLHFAAAVREEFAFLDELGYLEIEVCPTLIRYRRNDVEVDVHHGRRSYEIGAGISYQGTRYNMAEIIRAIDPEAFERYGGSLTSTPEGVGAGLRELSLLMRRFGVAALRGDSQFFSTLEAKRKLWVDDYWLDGLASQLRPQADEAFHRGDYLKAAQLYGRIRYRLSPAESKKLAIAEERCRV